MSGAEPQSVNECTTVGPSFDMASLPVVLRSASRVRVRTTTGFELFGSEVVDRPVRVMESRCQPNLRDGPGPHMLSSQFWLKAVSLSAESFVDRAAGSTILVDGRWGV